MKRKIGIILSILIILFTTGYIILQSNNVQEPIKFTTSKQYNEVFRSPNTYKHTSVVCNLEVIDADFWGDTTYIICYLLDDSFERVTNSNDRDIKIQLDWNRSQNY